MSAPSTLSRILGADTAGQQFLKAHEISSYALAGATPIAILSKAFTRLCSVMHQDGVLHKLADFAFALAIPVHMHIGMNACVSDYLPSVARGINMQSLLPCIAAPVRAGLLGMSAITAIGLLKLNLTGPGVTNTVKGMWHKSK